MCALTLGAGALAYVSAHTNAPVPLRRAAVVGGSWTLKVNTAGPGEEVVGGQILTPPSAFVVGITATWTGSGIGDMRGLLKRMWLRTGAANSSSLSSAGRGNGSVFGCALKQTPKDWHTITSVHAGKTASGSSLTGRACFLVDPGAVVAPQLRVLDPSCPSTALQATDCTKFVMFRLK